MKYKILSNTPLREGLELFDMRVCAPDFNALPGQIAHFLCGEGTTLRRPLSVCDCYSQSGMQIARFCYEVRGKGTKWISERIAGEEVDILGPLGHGFETVDGAKAVLVGGGIGIYPLMSLSRIYGKNAVALLGFRDAAHINLTEDFEAYGTEARVITDDGSSGRQGFVTVLLDEALKSGGYDIIYVCGPKPMMAAVSKIAEKYGVRCQVSMEEHMACGVGACLGCVCQTMLADGNHGYKRVCVDGPVFESSEIIWEAAK